MNATSKDSTTDSIQTNTVQKPVSVYSLNFSELLNDEERDFLMARVKTKKPAAVTPVKTNTRRNVQRGGAFLVVAIAAIGVFHFTFQLSFITREKAALTHKSVPAVSVETAPPAPIADVPADDFVVEKIEDAPPAKSVTVSRSRPALNPQPAKAAPKRRENTETRAERLRRAERILTGV